MTLALHRMVNHVIEILPRLVIRRDHERRVRVFDVFIRDGAQALLTRSDLMHATLLVKAFDGTMDVSTEVFDDCPQLRITLAHDFVQVHRLDTFVLELDEQEEGPPAEQLQRAERCLPNWKRLKP